MHMTLSLYARSDIHRYIFVIPKSMVIVYPAGLTHDDVYFQLLIKLDTELRSYESMHSIEEDSLSTQSTSDGSISTYTVTLINALHRMMSYFRQVSCIFTNL